MGVLGMFGWYVGMLHNQHEYGTLTESMTLLKPLQNESMLLSFSSSSISSPFTKQAN